MTIARKAPATFPLRLSPSIRSRIERLAQADGVSLNQFIAMTLAEKIGASGEREFFAERRANANLDDLRRIMNREGGEPPREGDELPEGYMRTKV